jgi:YD repeat-containing protein
MAILLPCMKSGTKQFNRDTIMSKLYEISLQHDAKGRIVRKEEKINGRPIVWEYDYDQNSRLTRSRRDVWCGGIHIRPIGTSACHAKQRPAFQLLHRSNRRLVVRGTEATSFTENGVLLNKVFWGKFVPYSKAKRAIIYNVTFSSTF